MRNDKQRSSFNRSMKIYKYMNDKVRAKRKKTETILLSSKWQILNNQKRKNRMQHAYKLRTQRRSECMIADF